MLRRVETPLRLVKGLILGNAFRRQAYKRLKKVSVNPETFNEHILFKMAYDRNPMRKIFSDKLASRQFVQERIGDQYLPRLYAVSDKVEDVVNRVNELKSFVLKVNHGSGGVIIVSDKHNDSDNSFLLPDAYSGIGWRRFRVSRENYSALSASNLLSYWLSLDYAHWPGKWPEWTYEGISRKCFAEELIGESREESFFDYRFYMFHGKLRLIGVDTTESSGKKTVKHYLPDWTPVDVMLRTGRKFLDEPKITHDKPNQFALAIEVAKELSFDIDWVRVDLFITSDSVFVGELTNFPTGGVGRYYPRSFDVSLGKYFDNNDTGIVNEK
jgi:hypothetical protein